MLTPLYILGALAVVGPIVFHLIRRTPRGEVPFSSLMFLAPSPPRLTRRSRLDHLLLLLLRAAALLLLAIAFARPFLRQAAQLDFGDVARRRVAVLIDTSASMRRGDLWQRAQAIANQEIIELRPTDQVALYAFDVNAHPLLSFEESATLDPVRRIAVAKGLLDGLKPTWAATNLGQSLIDTVSAIEDMTDTSEKAGRMPRRIVLVSDLQQGSRLEALGDFEWPGDVELDLKTVSDSGSNAGLQWLAASPESEPTDPNPLPRVRVFNDAGSHRERFQLLWHDDQGNVSGNATEAYVPPGESRVVRIPVPPKSSAKPSLKLTGDTNDFDDTLYIAAQPKLEAKVLYLGPDSAEDPAGLLYYLHRVFQSTPQRSVTVQTLAPAKPLTPELLKSVPLVVLATETTPENVRRLQEFVRGGGTLLDVLTAPGRVTALATLAGIPPWNAEAAPPKTDVMLGEIVFNHPLFAAFAPAQFNDFTKIHFWKYRRMTPAALADSSVVARFENGDPALVEKPLGQGRIIVLTSGWNPGDSQLARSSKFVPLMAAMLEGRVSTRLDTASLVVLDRVPLPSKKAEGPPLVVHKPDGTAVPLKANAPAFTDTDQPGVYSLSTPEGPRTFAVNLDPAESKVAPLHVETLEQFGCRLVNHSRTAIDREHLRQMHNIELENRQKLWRWLILAAIGILIVETWLAGRQTLPRLARAEAAVP